jgi:hypothetical protein
MFGNDLRRQKRLLFVLQKPIKRDKILTSRMIFYVFSPTKLVIVKKSVKFAKPILRSPARGEEKLRVGVRLDKPRGDAIWLIHGFSTIILTITNFNRELLLGTFFNLAPRKQKGQSLD